MKRSSKKHSILDHLRLSLFEWIILFVGIILTYFGFKVVFFLFQRDGTISWAMMTTIFAWLMLLVLFILLSMGVDASRKQLEEIKLLKSILKDEMKETRLFKEKVVKFSADVEALKKTKKISRKR